MWVDFLNNNVVKPSSLDDIIKTCVSKKWYEISDIEWWLSFNIWNMTTLELHKMQISWHDNFYISIWSGSKLLLSRKLVKEIWLTCTNDTKLLEILISKVEREVFIWIIKNKYNLPNINGNVISVKWEYDILLFEDYFIKQTPFWAMPVSYAKYIAKNS